MKKVTAVSFLEGVFVYSVAIPVIPNECNEGLQAGFN
jgi:hypothetical protein